jgi:hypothetical protein
MVTVLRYRPSALSVALLALVTAVLSTATLCDAAASNSRTPPGPAPRQPMLIGQTALPENGAAPVASGDLADHGRVIGQSVLDTLSAPPFQTRLGMDSLPYAIGGIVRSGAAANPPRQACAAPRACGNAPHAPNAIEKRDEVFGPIEDTGWTSFANLGNRRIYAFPETVRSTSKPVGAAATWGFGAQVDALRMTGLGRSDHEFFAYGEVRAAYADMPSPSTDAYRAQLTVGFGF